MRHVGRWWDASQINPVSHCTNEGNLFLLKLSLILELSPHGAVTFLYHIFVIEIILFKQVVHVLFTFEVHFAICLNVKAGFS